MPITIYVLKCRLHKYYVGKTNKSINKRYKQHVKGKGSAWTRKYKPVKLLKYSTGDSFDEDKITLQYMKKYGIDNVRGGSFCQCKLTKNDEETIIKMINSSTDRCYKCGEKGHFANKCSEESEEESEEEWEESTHTNAGARDGTIYDSSRGYIRPKRYKSRSKRSSGKCCRCGRYSHKAKNCYASTHISGKYL